MNMSWPVLLKPKNIFLVSAIAGKGMTTGAGFMKEVLEQNIY